MQQKLEKLVQEYCLAKVQLAQIEKQLAKRKKLIKMVTTFVPPANSYMEALETVGTSWTRANEAVVFKDRTLTLPSGKLIVLPNREMKTTINDWLKKEKERLLESSIAS